MSTLSYLFSGPGQRAVDALHGRRDMEHKLNPCPFCGGEALLESVRDGIHVFCRGCGAEGPPKYHAPKSIAIAAERAVEAWNKAAAERDRLKVINGELLAALELAVLWIGNWNPSFVDDPEWVEQDQPKIEAAIKAAKEG